MMRGTNCIRFQQFNKTRTLIYHISFSFSFARDIKNQIFQNQIREAILRNKLSAHDMHRCSSSTGYLDSCLPRQCCCHQSTCPRNNISYCSTLLRQLAVGVATVVGVIPNWVVAPISVTIACEP